MIQNEIPDCVRVVVPLHGDIKVIRDRELIRSTFYHKVFRKRRLKNMIGILKTLESLYLLSSVKDGLDSRNRFSNIHLDKRQTLAPELRVQNKDENRCNGRDSVTLVLTSGQGYHPEWLFLKLMKFAF